MALYRQKDIMEYRDLDEEDPKEIEASKYDLSYISLDVSVPRNDERVDLGDGAVLLNKCFI
jgi:hypothetical protein